MNPDVAEISEWKSINEQLAVLIDMTALGHGLKTKQGKTPHHPRPWELIEARKRAAARSVALAEQAVRQSARKREREARHG